MRKLVCAALLLAACSDPLGSGGVRVLPEQEAYAAFNDTQPVTVRYTVTNADDAPIGVPICGSTLSVQIQRKVNGEWATVAAPGTSCFAVFALRTIDPGRSVTDSVTVQGFGTWRVRVPFTRPQSESGFADSREFVTRVPPD
ncbi:MAG TPA: hypothetical protein VF541_17855 [Longimicrobium sp.]